MIAASPNRTDRALAAQLFKRAGEELRSRRPHQAIPLFRGAEDSGYDADSCAAGRWNCHMLLGDFEAAWEESDEIARRGNPDPHRFWNGQSFDGKRVLVRCLHGLGDTIQFIRYAPLVRREAKTLIIEAQPRLRPLMECCGLAGSIITWGEPEPEWDLQIEVMELPRIFRATVSSIPASVPYLRIPAASRLRETRHVRVGLVWASGGFNPARSIPLKTLSGICSAPGIEFCSFQAGPERCELAACPVPIEDWDEKTNSVLEAARSLADIDLLITVDTMMAHLAGALGRPVWTLLPYDADWRWMLNRSDSPWYPSMRLFRQASREDWNSVVKDVRNSLEGYTGAGPGRVK